MHGIFLPGRKRTVRSSLLETYSLVILVSFLVLALTVAAIQIPRTREQTFSVLRQNSQSVASGIGSECNQMRTVALNIAYATQLQDRLILLNTQNGTGSAAKLSMILSLIVFPNRQVDQINLYSSDGGSVHSGLRNELAQESAEAQSWYPLPEEAENHLLFYCSGPDESLNKYISDPADRRFVSLVMENRDQFNNPCGYIEIRQRMSRVFSSVFSYATTYGEEICVFDAGGRLVYPEGRADGDAVYRALNGQTDDHEFHPAEINGESVFLRGVPAGSEFLSVMVIRRSDLDRPVRQLILNIVLATLGALGLTFLLSHFASRRITEPIGTLCRQISSVDPEHPSALPPAEKDLAELAALRTAFNQMQLSLSDHVSRLLLLKNQEMQSRMLALQAQMNPHFLFNSLAAIQAMSDAGLNDEVSVMCQSMSRILRYISSDTSQEVPLRDELSYTEDYLTCMDLRYRGDLQYRIDVPDELGSVLVPKLCVQLLVENAIKFTTTRRPPYRIDITGCRKEDRYELRIRDNGPGFEEATLRDLEEKMAEIRQTSTLPSLKIHGMGILNVFIRYCLLYENRFVFRLENNPEGGASVVIGAYMHGSEV